MPKYGAIIIFIAWNCRCTYVANEFTEDGLIPRNKLCTFQNLILIVFLNSLVESLRNEISLNDKNFLIQCLVVQISLYKIKRKEFLPCAVISGTLVVPINPFLSVLHLVTHMRAHTHTHTHTHIYIMNKVYH